MVLSVFSPDNFTTCFIEETLKQYDHPTTQRSIESVAGGNFSLMSATVLSGHLHGGQEAVCTFAPPPVMALTLLISGSFPSAVSRFYSTRIFCNLSHSGWCLLHFINVEKILFLPSSPSFLLVVIFSFMFIRYTCLLGNSWTKVCVCHFFFSSNNFCSS